MDRMLRAAPNVSRRGSPRTPALVAALALGLTVAVASTAQSPAGAPTASGQSMSVPLAPDAPETYVVKSGDTLWDIAGVFLKYPWYWPEIWYVNPQIANPHWIYPGDVLRLSWVDGKPRVTVDTASAVRLSPEVRTNPLSQSIKAIPYDLLMTFVQRPSLLTEKQVDKGPYVVGFRDRHIVGAGINEFYAKGLGAPAPGTEFSVVHPGEELRDPDDGDLLGYIGHYAATGRVITTSNAKRDDGLTHLIPVDTGREIAQGDKLFPAKPKFGDDFVPSTPSNTKLNGQVLAIVDGLAVAGKYQVLAINRGTRDGLKPGNVVAIFSRGAEVSDFYSRSRDWTSYTANYATVKLPDERSGTLLLFTVYDRISYGLVVESIGEMRIGDFIKHPDYGHDEAGVDSFAR